MLLWLKVCLLSQLIACFFSVLRLTSAEDSSSDGTEGREGREGLNGLDVSPDGWGSRRFGVMERAPRDRFQISDFKDPPSRKATARQAMFRAGTEFFCIRSAVGKLKSV
jgi:hypothetical protein